MGTVRVRWGGVVGKIGRERHPSSCIETFVESKKKLEPIRRIQDVPGHADGRRSRDPLLVDAGEGEKVGGHGGGGGARDHHQLRLVLVVVIQRRRLRLRRKRLRRGRVVHRSIRRRRFRRPLIRRRRSVDRRLGGGRRRRRRRRRRFRVTLVDLAVFEIVGPNAEGLAANGAHVRLLARVQRRVHLRFFKTDLQKVQLLKGKVHLIKLKIIYIQL